LKLKSGSSIIGKKGKRMSGKIKLAQKISMSLKTILILSITAVFLLGLFIIFTIRAFRPVSYIISVEDKLYEEYVKNTPLISEEKKLLFIKENDREALKEGFFGPVLKNAAVIQSHKDLALLAQDLKENQRFFPTSSESLLPWVNEKGHSISFSTLNELPEGKRALSVDESYADNENYKLLVREGALCSVYEASLSDTIFNYCQRLFPSPEDKESSQLVTIASVGDIMVARGVQEILIDKEDGLNTVFADTLPILQGADFTIGNLEGVVTDSWKNATKTYTFKFKKAVLPKLQQAGFDYLMQTNNHCYDYGESGFKDTLAAFEEYKIPSSGIGKNKEEAEKFYHITIKGLPVSVISCGAFPVENSGFNGEKTATATDKRAGILWKSDRLLEQVKAEKEAGNFVIVNVHGGEEYHFTPSKKQRKFYEELCDKGADVVFGSHPHVLQPSEWHGNSLIVFSMGNFIFNGMEGMRGATDSEIVKIGVLNGRIVYVEHYPARIKENGVCLKN